jgi:transposase
MTAANLDAQSARATDDPPQPMPEILGRLADELRDAAARTDRLHRLAESIAWRDVEEKHELIRSAQAIDAIEQTLSALSDFVSALAELTPRQWEVAGGSASRRVRLAELAARLADRPLVAGAEHAGGDSEFF